VKQQHQQNGNGSEPVDLRPISVVVLLQGWGRPRPQGFHAALSVLSVLDRSCVKQCLSIDFSWFFRISLQSKDFPELGRLLMFDLLANV
jgi:hypothetical protein